MSQSIKINDTYLVRYNNDLGYKLEPIVVKFEGQSISRLCFVKKDNHPWYDVILASGVEVVKVGGALAANILRCEQWNRVYLILHSDPEVAKAIVRREHPEHAKSLDQVEKILYPT